MAKKFLAAFSLKVAMRSFSDLHGAVKRERSIESSATGHT